MPKISVIVPVYNAEKYLHRCIDSILAQTFTDFELLLINDGSKDGSGAICDEYAQKDPRVRVFHKENGGVSSARNVGLDEAKGEWVCFVDSDDWINPDYFEIIKENEQYDLVTIAYAEYGKNNMHNGSENNSIFQLQKDAFDLLNFSPTNRKKTPYLSSCTHLFKRYLLEKNKIRFNKNLKIGEDTIFVIDYLSYCNNIIQLSKICYNYRIDETPFAAKYALDGTSVRIHCEELKESILHYCNNHKCTPPQLYYSNTATYIRLFCNYLQKEKSTKKIKAALTDANLTYSQMRCRGRKATLLLTIMRYYPKIAKSLLNYLT